MSALPPKADIASLQLDRAGLRPGLVVDKWMLLQFTLASAYR